MIQIGKLFILIASLFLSCIACYNKQKTSNEIKENIIISENQSDLPEIDDIAPEDWKFDTLSFQKTIYLANDSSKRGVSTDITFTYPVSAPKGIDLNDIQKTFSTIFSNEDNFSGSPKQAFDAIVDSHILEAQKQIEEWEKDEEFIPFTNYTQNKGNSIDYLSKDLISTYVGYYSYSGGAHGIYYLRYYNIDFRDYKVIEENQLFKAGYEAKLAALIQNKIKERNSSTDESEHISLLADISEIEPNQNFCFSENGIDYIYNQNEISPYSQGIVEIYIPFEEIEPLLNDKYQKVFTNIN